MKTTRQPQFGLLMSSLCPASVDLALIARVDFIWIDAEHTGVGPREVAQVVGRASGSSTKVLVRVQDHDSDSLIAFANTGVDELILPRVRSLELVRTAWEAVNYPPNGKRPRQMVPASRYGLEWGPVPSLSVIVETLEAAHACQEFANDERVAGIWIGPRDLEDDCKAAGLSTTAAKEVTDGVVADMAAGRAIWGLGASTDQDLADALKQGARRCVLYWESYQRTRLEALASLVDDSRGRTA